MEKVGERGFGKAVGRGSGFIFAGDESGVRRSHIGPTHYILVRSTADSPTAPDANANGAGLF